MRFFRFWRKIHSYRTFFLFFSCIIAVWLIFLDPCLVGLSKLCRYDKFYDGNERDNKRHSLRLVQENPMKVCPIFSMKHSSNSLHGTESVACKVASPHPDSCDIAKKLFHSKPTSSCSHQRHYEFCYLEKSEIDSWVVTCNATEAQVCDSNLSLGLPNPEKGNMNWNTYSDTQKLADELTFFIHKPHFKLFGFAFIKCSSEGSTQTTENVMAYDPNNNYDSYYSHEELPNVPEQLLLLPPLIKPKNYSENLDRLGLDVNVNIILIDSTSRQHFFRSLKKSVEVLETISSDLSSTAYVLDFELMQAIKSRTFETLQAIFSGYVNVTETPFPVHGIPSKPLNLSPIFQNFRKNGYRTLWLEDLCYLWEWGISKDLHFLDLNRDPSDTWKLMWQKLGNNGVDDIDLTISMCKILDANKMKDPFRSTNNVCFNGKHQHEYILEYLKLYQMQMKASDRPYLTVTSINVGHEETGRRIQTLDKDLANYISFLPSMDNSLSIVFSDHGNAYGQFFEFSQEAQTELFHPFMFFIIPKKVASKFSQAMISALQVNTKRLISALDLHYTLLFLANGYHPEEIVLHKDFPVSRTGLFEPVHPLRTCNSIPRIPPNLCICDNKAKSIKSSSFQALFGYHAVGAINTEIQRQYLAAIHDKSTIHTAYGRCEPLRLRDVSEIKETESQDSTESWKVNMNIHVQESQVFFISVIVSAGNENHLAVSLETVSRVTKYGHYEECADTGVELSLCICNISASTNKLFNVPTASYYARMEAIPHSQHSLQNLAGQEMCLLLFTVLHNHGMAVFVASTCKKSFIFNMEVVADKKYIYSAPASNVLLLPGSFVYLALVRKSRGEAYCPLHSHYQEVKNVEDYLYLGTR